ncbi:methylation-associated defense system protein kinase MAD6 [Phormidesmis sp. 146-12]
MADIIRIGELANDIEREIIRYLDGNLSDDYVLIHNLELKSSSGIYEIDLVIIAPHSIFVVDIKGTGGRVEIIEPNWYPENRQSFPSPVKKLRHHAKTLKSLIVSANPARRRVLNDVHVQEVVLMASEDSFVVDKTGLDEKSVVSVKDCLKYFKDLSHIPAHRLTDIRPFALDIKTTIRGRAEAPSTVCYGDWQIEEELGGNSQYTEYRAIGRSIAKRGLTTRLRVYPIDLYQDTATREKQLQLMTTAYRAVFRLTHDGILKVQDCIEPEEGDRVVLVSEDIAGQVLRQQIEQNQQSFTLDQKLGFIREILIALNYAHKHGVIHRNITPDSFLITTQKQILLTGFDYARIQNHGSSIADDIVDALDAYTVYQAPECHHDPAKATVVSDLFAAGLVFYELLTGKRAFDHAQQMVDSQAVFLNLPSKLNAEVSTAIDSWLQKFCKIKPSDRYESAREALDELIPIASEQHFKASLPLDLTNLLPGTLLDNHFLIRKRLGKPGSFAVAYQVLDTLRGVERVMKLVLRDRYSVSERLRQEYVTLEELPEHQHVVKVRWGGYLRDETPYIIFDYLEGRDVDDLIAQQQLSADEALKIVKQTALGLAHLHNNGVYHQDIKPSNLLLTNQGIRIIDFNIAVSEQEEISANAGTRRYIPPDFNFSAELDSSDRIDRDLYALGITFYECLTGGHYPFEEAVPPTGKEMRDPRSFDACTDLEERLVKILMKATAPQKCNRFSSAIELVNVLEAICFPITTTADASVEHSIEHSVEHSNLATSSDQTAQDIEIVSVEAQIDVEIGISPNYEIHAVKTDESLDSYTIDFQQSVYGNGSGNGRGSFSSIRYNADSKVVLDPTNLYPVPPDYIAVTTERQWVEKFFVLEGSFWVRGESLCTWAEAWLRAHDKASAIVEVKQNPRTCLEALLAPVEIPSEWNAEQIIDWSTRLDSYSSENSIAHLLADAQPEHRNIWLGEPSHQHLANWLSVQLPGEYQVFEQVWQQRIKAQNHSFSEFYGVTDKNQLLKQWLGLTGKKDKRLGQFPVEIPDSVREEFTRFWDEKLIQTKGAVLEQCSSDPSPEMAYIATRAYRLLKKHPHWITHERKDKIYNHLSFQQQQEITSQQPPQLPNMLKVDANLAEALNWVTQGYLPFRGWETTASPQAESNQSECLADSFVDWLVKQYPQLREDKVERSVLNYSVASLVQELCEQHPVLWVVVDGLGWRDHEELLRYITKDQALSTTTALEPRISILPTKTGYAKWSLYAQLPPDDSFWEERAGKAFPLMLKGKKYRGERYTDYTKDTLIRDLKEQKYQLYCWDTTCLDELYHRERDWQSLHNLHRPHMLELIAKQILSFVQMYPNSDQLKIVIASDHGQLMGCSSQLTDLPHNIQAKGRIALGKVNDPRFIILEADRFRLPQDISVVRGTGYCSGSGSNVGFHGGLFPEEVIIGVSVLQQKVERNPIAVLCEGTGKAGQDGTIDIHFHNPNSLPLTNLKLYIEEIEELRNGLLLESRILPDQEITLTIPLAKCPELPPTESEKCINLTGRVEFYFADTECGKSSISQRSKLVIKQLFSSGFDIDDFL